MINALKSAGHSVTGIFTSPYRCEELFDDTGLFDEHIVLISKSHLVRFGLFSRPIFDLAILDRFASTRKHFWLAHKVAKSTRAQQEPENVSARLLKRVEFRLAQEDRHDVLNHLGLVDDLVSTNALNYAFLSTNPDKNYVVFQPGSGNNKTPWKSWPVQDWLPVLERIDAPITVIGDRSELDLVDELKASGISQLDIRIGQQTISEMAQTVGEATLYLGHDSGPMHIAVSCGVPTFVVWGTSPLHTYAYHELFPDLNKVVQGQVEDISGARISGLDSEEVCTQLTSFLHDIGSTIHIQ